MAKNIIIISSVIITIVAISLFRSNRSKPTATINLKLNGYDYQIEIASTMSQKSAGLSKRNYLCPNCGMIFLFNYQGTLPFWMKDTIIPLDMIWMDQSGKIVDLKTITETNSLKIIQNSTPAKYVLELNAGDCQKINLKIGDIIQLPNFHEI